jgi:hypothetical protein
MQAPLVELLPAFVVAAAVDLLAVDGAQIQVQINNSLPFFASTRPSLICSASLFPASLLS